MISREGVAHGREVKNPEFQGVKFQGRIKTRRGTYNFQEEREEGNSRLILQ
jgi:hypothetical protein